MSLISTEPDHSDQRELRVPAEFFASLQTEITHCNEDATVAVLMVSLQRTDHIAVLLNPGYAQNLMQQLRARIVPILRGKDRFLLIGDNEIWLLLPQLASEALAILAVHRLIGALLEPLKVDQHPVFLSPCAGIATAPRHHQSALGLLRMTESALKHALSEHLPFLMAESDEAHYAMPDNLPQELGEVLAANELEVEYQPKVDLRTRKMVSVEALVRWPKDHPQQVTTTMLIEVAERTGMVETLTMRVLNMVLQAMRQWKIAGTEVLVWVNLSARLLELEHLPAMLERTLAIWDVPASHIGLEITESAFIRDIEHSTNMLFQLKKLGFHLSIDDFGTGYSSLAYLRRFPIDELKIDRMFIHGMSTSLQDRQIVRSIIDLAHNFGLPVVAEGVETEATLKQLEALGCDQIQGYLFAYPMPAKQLLSWHAEFHQSSKSKNA